MIPQNATEKVLATQSYVGITRPHRSSTPIINLNIPASKSVSSAGPSANIVSGEIILAIPSHASAKIIVSLAKQILANAHIQKLMHKQKRTRNASAKKKSPFSRNRSSKSSTKHLTYEQETDLPTPVPSYAKSLEGKSAQRGLEGNPISEISFDHTEKSAEQNSTTPLLSALLSTSLVTPAKSSSLIKDNLVNKKILCKTGPLQDKTPAKRQFSPVGVLEECTDTVTSFEISTSEDMLNAFLSKEAISNMCRTSYPTDDNTFFDSPSCGDSADGGSSLTTSNSLESWSLQHSMSSSLVSRYAAMHLEDEIAALHRQAMLRKRRFARQMKILKHCALVVWLASVSCYCMDSNGLYAAGTRTKILEEPLGMMGFVQFLLCFVSLLKFQRLFQKPVVPISQSRCPVLQWMSQLYESRVAATTNTNNAVFAHAQQGY